MDFYTKDAMLDRKWEQENQELRHLFTRLAIHGFHHKICNSATYHIPSENCVCRLCGNRCDRYHIAKCMKRVKSLKDYGKTKEPPFARLCALSYHHQMLPVFLPIPSCSIYRYSPHKAFFSISTSQMLPVFLLIPSCSIQHYSPHKAFFSISTSQMLPVILLIQSCIIQRYFPHRALH